MVGYLKELGDVREMLDNRYEEMKRGRIKAVDGETAFAELRRRGEKRRAHSLIHDVRAGMSEFVLHPDALKDLEEVWEYPK